MSLMKLKLVLPTNWVEKEFHIFQVKPLSSCLSFLPVKPILLLKIRLDSFFTRHSMAIYGATVSV